MSSGCGGAPSPVASHHRPLRDLPEPSPAGVLLIDVRPAGCGHRCHAAVVGRPPSLRLPTFRPDSSGVGKGSGLPGVGADAGGSVLASAPLVFGPSRACCWRFPSSCHEGGIFSNSRISTITTRTCPCFS